MIFVYIPAPSVNYCDGLGRCFRLVCIYACAAVFFDATVFSVNKDLYILRHHQKPNCGKIVAAIDSIWNSRGQRRSNLTPSFAFRTTQLLSE